MDPEIQRKQRVKIERLGRKFYYVPPEPPPERPRELKPQKGDAEFHYYLNYKSPYSVRNLNVDGVEVIPDNSNAILAAKARAEALVRHRFSGKVASMLHYGVWPARAESRNFAIYRRGERDEWHDL